MNAEQLRIIDEWRLKSQSDLKAAEHLLAADDASLYDAVCFHCQQAIEKRLKALLLKKNSRPPKTHDLRVLAGLLKEMTPPIIIDEDGLDYLHHFAVEYRYPGYRAVQEEAQEAILLCKALCEQIDTSF